MRDHPSKSFAILTFFTAIAGCGGGTTPPPDDVLLAPPPAGQGVQYEMTTKIDAGGEVQRCKFVQAPAEGMNVNHDEVRFTAGSHHFLLYETSYTAIPTKKDDGSAIDTSGVFDCTSGATNGWSVTKLIGGSQNGKGTSMLQFPPDVALRVTPGAVLLMNAHYINTSASAVEPDVRINLFTIPDAQVKQEGDILFLYDAFIKVPAQGKGQARMRCPIRSDITLTNFQSHMHARGVGYSASLDGAAPFYTNGSWENVPVEQFTGGMTIKAGSVIDYACDYSNTAANDVYQGPSATDEMCMAIGSFYPKDPATANCASDPANPGLTSSLGGQTGLGSGTATCAATMSCLQQAFAQSDPFHPMTTCVLAADPAVASEVSNLFRCIALSSDPLNECKTQIADCSAK